MAVVLTDKAVFIHLPRCGGSYTIEVLKALGLVRLRMPSAPHVPPHFFQYYGEKYRFAFVRHPWDWLKSYYRLKFATSRHPAIWLDKMIDASKSFEHWIELIYGDGRKQVVGEYMYPYIGSGADRIEFVGRYENLRDDLMVALTNGRLLVDGVGPNGRHYDDIYNDKCCTQFFRPLSDDLSDFVVAREPELIGEFYASDLSVNVDPAAVLAAHRAARNSASSRIASLVAGVASRRSQ